MLSARISARSGRNRVLRVALPAILLLIAGAPQGADASTLSLLDDKWVLQAEEVGTTFSALKIGGFGEGLSQGCFAAAPPSCPVIPDANFEIDLIEDGDGNPDTYDITLGANDNTTILGQLVSGLYAPNQVGGNFGETFMVSGIIDPDGDAETLNGDLNAVIEGTLVATGNTARIVLEPIEFTVTLPGAEPKIDVVRLMLSTEANVDATDPACMVSNASHGMDLDLTTGEMRLQGVVCLADGVNNDIGQYLTFTLEGNVVPEPGTFLLTMTGLVGLGLLGARGPAFRR